MQTLMRTIEKARSFEGGTLGFGAKESEASTAFKKLLARREPAYFLSLLGSDNPAARVYGVRGLESLGFEGKLGSVLPLLDDDEAVNLFLNCEHSVSQVSIETFRSLAEFAPEKSMEDVTAAIFREAARAELESQDAGSKKVRKKTIPPKLTMALHRARSRPTLASLAYLLLCSHDLEGAEALLETELTSEVNAARREAIERALESEQAPIRATAARVAAQTYLTEYFASIAALCQDRHPDVSRAAVNGLADIALVALEAETTAPAPQRPDRETILTRTLEELKAALDRGGPGRKDAALGLERLSAAAFPKPDTDTARTSSNVLEGVSPGVRELFLTTLAHALINGHGQQLELAESFARADEDGARVVEILTGDISGIDPRAMSALVGAIERNPESRATFVADAIEQLKTETDTPWKTKLYLIRALGQLREPSARVVLAGLQSDAHARVAAAAKKALAGLRRVGAGRE